MHSEIALLPSLVSVFAVALVLTACGSNGSTSSGATSQTTTETSGIAASPSAAPQITSFTPTIGTAGTTVTITGSGFTGATGVWFTIKEGPSAPFGVVSDTKINLIVPADVGGGILGVDTPRGMAWSSTGFTARPTLSSFSPHHGPVGSLVTINGTCLNSVSVYFEPGLQAPWNCTGCWHGTAQIKIRVPSGAVTGRIKLGYLVDPLNDAYEFVGTPTPFTVTPPPPRVTSLSPMHATPGATITATGSGFTGVTEVAFPGDVQASYTVVSDTKITFVVPPAATSGGISITNSASLAQTFSVPGFVVDARITGFSPMAGAVGTVITITGTGFAGTTKVAFNGGDGSILSTTPTTIRVRVPEGAKSGQIAVTTTPANNTSVAPGTFTVGPGPRIASLSPQQGPVGSTVTLTGAGFTGTTIVHFAPDANSAFTVVSDTKITLVVPAGAKTGAIGAHSPFGNAQGPVFGVIPRITRVTPKCGKPGTPVTITGTGFAGLTNTLFGDKTATVSSQTPTEIRAVVPAGAVTAFIKVIVAGGYEAHSPSMFELSSRRC